MAQSENMCLNQKTSAENIRASVTKLYWTSL